MAKKQDGELVFKGYYDTIQLVERLHRHSLDVLKFELDRHGIQDINNIQTMILYNIGEDDLTVGELHTRGYYHGTNVSYNLKEMVKNGYLVQERSIHDRRSVRIKLSAKGAELREKIKAMFEKHVRSLNQIGIATESMATTNETLARLERFWSNMIEYPGMSAISAA